MTIQCTDPASLILSLSRRSTFTLLVREYIGSLPCDLQGHVGEDYTYSLSCNFCRFSYAPLDLPSAYVDSQSRAPEHGAKAMAMLSTYNRIPQRFPNILRIPISHITRRLIITNRIIRRNITPGLRNTVRTMHGHTSHLHRAFPY